MQQTDAAEAVKCRVTQSVEIEIRASSWASFFKPQWVEREEMEHAIDNEEIGFIVFSKLTSHDWAQRLRLSAPKESNAIETLPASQCSLSYLFAARSLTLCSRSLSLLHRFPCGSEGRTINT